MKNLINDIRISDSRALQELLRVRNATNRFGIAYQFKLLADRYALKLRSLKFAAKNWPVYYLALTPALSHGTIELGSHGYLCGINMQIFDASDKLTKDQFMTEAIYRMLTDECNRSGLDIEKVLNVYELLMSVGDELKIGRVEKCGYDCRFEVSFTIERTPRLFLTVESNLGTKDLLLVELDEYNDAYNLAATLTVSKSHVRIYPRRSAVGRSLFRRYRDRLAEKGFLANTGTSMEVSMLGV